MPLIPPGVLADLRTLVTDSLTDTGTITRTGVTAPCRVMEGSRDLRLTGQADGIRLVRWDLIFPDGTNLSTGDTVTVPGKGVYLVAQVLGPTTTSVETAARAYQTNATVTFHQAGTTQKLAGVPALIAAATRDQQTDVRGSAFEFSIAWDASLVFPAMPARTPPLPALPPGTDDLLEWSGLQGASRRVALQYVTRFAAPSGWAQSTFRDSVGA